MHCRTHIVAKTRKGELTRVRAAAYLGLSLDHVHFETVDGSRAATELYGRVFKPTVHREIYAFEDLPRAMEEMHQNVQTGIPIVRIAKELPESVRKLARA